MLRLQRARQRVGFSPGDTVDSLQRLPGHAKLEVVLSGHLVRYAVLPWSSALSSESEWMAYAQHRFASTYGNVAANWRIRMCATGRRKPRVACAVDAGLLESLRQIRRVVSVQPGLMAAFNAHRGAFERESGWFVVQEPRRLTLSLIVDGSWKLIRGRQAHEDWRDTLPDLLDREIAASGEPPCARVVLHCHDEPPRRLERYKIAARSVN